MKQTDFSIASQGFIFEIMIDIIKYIISMTGYLYPVISVREKENK